MPPSKSNPHRPSIVLSIRTRSEDDYNRSPRIGKREYAIIDVLPGVKPFISRRIYNMRAQSDILPRDRWALISLTATPESNSRCQTFPGEQICQICVMIISAGVRLSLCSVYKCPLFWTPNSQSVFPLRPRPSFRSPIVFLFHLFPTESRH